MDRATRWETEALRTGRRPSVSQKRGDSRHWVTLREAATRTGVPIGTVRSWSKSDAVDTYLELDGERALRMVDLDGVEARARRLGRQAATEQRDEEAPGPGRETMIVPLDAWNKMLLQLGNLHEAGQQLAEARERAARAETEAKFLREQLRELRQRLDADPPHADVVAPPPDAAQETTGRGAEPAASFGATVADRARRLWRALR